MRVMHGVMSRSVLVSDWFVVQQLTLDDHFSDFHMCLLDSGSLSIPHTILHTNDHTYNFTQNQGLVLALLLRAQVCP